MENYFNYFTEIEEHFMRRRGTILLLSTLDWALIETWKDAGVPLAAVLRGIDSTFEKFEKRPTKTRKVNGLAYCSQEVLAAAEEMADAAVGAHREEKAGTAEAGFEQQRIATYLAGNSETMRGLIEKVPIGARDVLAHVAQSLADLASGVVTSKTPLEDLERHLTVLEEKIYAALMMHAPDADLVQVRAAADRDIAPYRSKMKAPQIEQLHNQYVNKKLLEKYGVPRLSLFYMR